MDLRKLKKLIDLVQESGIAELEITEGEEKVKIVKGGVVSMAAAPTVMAVPAAAPAPSAAAAAPPPPKPPPPGAGGPGVEGPVVRKFHRMPSPGAQALVE